MATWTDLKTAVGARDDLDAFTETCWDTAVELVERYIGDNFVPDVVQDKAKLNVGAELFNAKDAKNGIAQFASFDGQNAARIPRDPMVAGYGLLNPWLVVGF